MAGDRWYSQGLSCFCCHISLWGAGSCAGFCTCSSCTESSCASGLLFSQIWWPDLKQTSRFQEFCFVFEVLEFQEEASTVPE